MSTSGRTGAEPRRTPARLRPLLGLLAIATTLALASWTASPSISAAAGEPPWVVGTVAVESGTGPATVERDVDLDEFESRGAAMIPATQTVDDIRTRSPLDFAFSEIRGVAVHLAFAASAPAEALEALQRSGFPYEMEEHVGFSALQLAEVSDRVHRVSVRLAPPGAGLASGAREASRTFEVEVDQPFLDQRGSVLDPDVVAARIATEVGELYGFTVRVSIVAEGSIGDAGSAQTGGTTLDCMPTRVAVGDPVGMLDASVAPCCALLRSCASPAVSIATYTPTVGTGYDSGLIQAQLIEDHGCLMLANGVVPVFPDDSVRWDGTTLRFGADQYMVADTLSAGGGGLLTGGEIRAAARIPDVCTAERYALLDPPTSRGSVVEP